MYGGAYEKASDNLFMSQSQMSIRLRDRLRRGCSTLYPEMNRVYQDESFVSQEPKEYGTVVYIPMWWRSSGFLRLSFGDSGTQSTRDVFKEHLKIFASVTLDQ